MLEFVARRGLLAVLILFLAVSLLFAMIHMMPGDPASVILGPKASPELKAELSQRMGLDQPLMVQLGRFYADLAQGDLGVDVFTDRQVSDIVFEQLFGEAAPQINEEIREVVLDKNRQYFRRYRPLNTFYYTGDRSKTYGYLDFLPAMRNFEIMTQNREGVIWDYAQGKTKSTMIDDSNLPEMPAPKESRGGNKWMSLEDELAAFKIDPRFEVNCFASEEEFPDMACTIQMRCDSKGRLWVSCSTTYPHLYPGQEPRDKDGRRKPPAHSPARAKVQSVPPGGTAASRSSPEKSA